MSEPQDPNEQYGGAYPPPGYGQPQYGQPQYDQAQYGQPQYGQPQYDQAQYDQTQYGQPQYGQPPGYGGYPGYQNAPGQQPGHYPGQPGYGPQQAPNYGGQFPGYPPPIPPRLGYGSLRPGMAIGSAVLSFVTAGLLIISSIVLFAAASTINKIDSQDNFFDFHNAVAELTTDGFLDLVAAAVLITAGVTLLGRRRISLVLTLVGQGLTIAYAIYWISRTSSDPGAVSTAVLFIALAAISVSLVIPPSVRAWLNRPTPA